MAKINGRRLICLDIETTGFSGTEDTLICLVVKKGHEVKVVEDMDQLRKMRDDNYFNGVLCTYNGENWKGGFDFPFLRSYCLAAGEEWVFKDLMHIDLYPLVRKYLNTEVYIEEPPAKSRMKKDDVTRLAFANGIEYSTVKNTYSDLLEMHENGGVDWLDYSEVKTVSRNGLNDVYKMFFDPEEGEDYTEGAEVPELYAAGDMESIVEHCKDDVIRLSRVADTIIPYFPQWEIDRSMRTL